MDALRRRPREPEDGSEVIGLAVGVLGALALSVAMIPLRDHLHNDNMALALVVPVLLGAVLGGRWSGAVSALAAALCFDFFFTQPYQSLRISSRPSSLVSASSTAFSSIRWLVVCASAPLSNGPEGATAQAHPPGPGFPEQAPSV